MSEVIGGIAVRVNPDTTTFGARLRTAVKRASEGVRPSVTVTADTSGALREINAFSARATAATRDRKMTVRVDTDRGLDALGQKLRNLGEVTDALSGPGRLGALVAGVGAVGVSAVGASGGVIALAAALAQVSGAGAAAVTGLAGMGLVAGTIRLGFRGIGEAVKAVNERTASAAQSAGQHAAAANAVRAAQERVADATRRVADAQRAAKERVVQALERVQDAEQGLSAAQRSAQQAQQALNQARAEAADRIRDLDLSLRRAVLSEDEAALSLQEAQERLAALQSQAAGVVDAAEMRRAELNVRSAQLSLEEARDRTQDLREEQQLTRRLGVEGDAQVVAARERVADADRQVQEAREDLAKAQREVAKAQAEGSRQVADAVRALERAQRDAAEAAQNAGGQASAAFLKAQEALEALSPAGRRFVQFITGELQPAVDRLQRQAQEALLPGVQSGLESLLVLEPLVGGAVTRIGERLGGLAQRAGEMMASAPWQATFRGITDTTDQSLGMFGNAALSFANSLRILADAGQPLLLWFAQVTERGAAAFDAFLQESEASGALGDFIERTKTTLSTLLDITKSLGGIFVGMFTAGQEPGQRLLETVAGLFGRINEWVNSAGGQAALGTFFERGATFLEGLISMIEGFGPILAPIIDHASRLAEQFGNFAKENPQIAAIVATIVGLGAAMIPLIGPTVAVVGAIVKLGTVGLVIGSIVGVVLALGAAFGALMVMSEPLRTQVVGLFQDLWARVQQVGAVVRDIVMPPFQRFMTLMRDQVAPAIAQAVAHVRDQLAPAFDRLVQALRDNEDKFRAVLNVIVTVATWIGQNVIPVLVQFGGFVLRLVIDSITNTVNALGWMISAAQWLWDKIKAVGAGITAAWDWLKTRALDLWNWLNTQFNNIKNAAQSFWDKVNEVGANIQRAWDMLKARAMDMAMELRRRFEEVRDAITAMRDRINEKINDVLNWFRDLPGKIKEKISSLPEDLRNWGRDAIQKLIDGAKEIDLGQQLKDFVSGAVDKVKDFLGIRSPSRVFQDIGNNIVRGLLNGVVNNQTAVQDKLVGMLGGSAKGVMRVGGRIVSGVTDMFEGADPTLSATISGDSWQAIANFIRAKGVPHRITSTVRPGAITATGNLSRHALGKAVDLAGPRPGDTAAMMKIWQALSGLPLRELIYSPAPFQIFGGRRVKGAPSNAAVRNAHYDHVHAAFAQGGLITEPVFGMGLRTGRSYSLAEHGPERVTSITKTAREGARLTSLVDLTAESTRHLRGIAGAVTGASGMLLAEDESLVPASFYDKLSATALSGLEDAVRAAYVELNGLPEVPSGFTWAEDYTLVPNSFYERLSATAISGIEDDERRFAYVDSFGLPDAPTGYQWAEDYTLVPESFYSGGTPMKTAQPAGGRSITVQYAPVVNASGMSAAEVEAMLAREREELMRELHRMQVVGVTG